MRPYEVIAASEKFKMVLEMLKRPCVTRASPGEIRRALPDGEVEALGERGVQLRRVFRVEQGVVKLLLCASQELSIHPDDPVVSPGLHHLAVDAGRSQEAVDY